MMLLSKFPRFRVYQRKAKTLLNYVFIILLLFCFYIVLVNIDCRCFRFAKIQRNLHPDKYIFIGRCAKTKSTARDCYGHRLYGGNLFRKRSPSVTPLQFPIRSPTNGKKRSKIYITNYILYIYI